MQLLEDKELSKNEYAFRLGQAMGLADADWNGTPDFRKWENRYINTMLKMSREQAKDFLNTLKYNRVYTIENMLKDHPELDKTNTKAIETLNEIFNEGKNNDNS